MNERWWFRMARYGYPQWRGILLLVALLAVGALFDVLRPWPVKLIIDHVFDQASPLPDYLGWLEALPGASGRTGLLGWLTAGTMLLFLGGWLCKVAQNYLQAGVASRMVYALGADLFGHLQSLSLRFHGRRATGDLVQRVTGDSECVRAILTKVALPLLTSCLTIASMLLIMWGLDPVLTLVAVGVTPLLGICIWWFAGPMEERAYTQYNIQGEVLACAEQTLVALPMMKAFTREPYQDERFADAWRRENAAALGVAVSEIQFNVSTGAVTAAGTAAVLALGGYHVLSGLLTTGSLVVFLSYLVSLYAPIETLAYLSAGFANAKAQARRVLEVLDSDDGVQEKPDAVGLPERARGAISIEEVTFGYEPGRAVLHGISLAGSPGETVALVGATGAGKSTLVSLIPRLFDPWEGRVMLDGVDVRDLRLDSLRDQISIVLQEPFILPLTVRENIAYGRPDARQPEIEAAAAAANAVEFIQDLPEGYDTVVGERGATLSGGQQQRLSIARALLKDAPVLVLDEPTSALDAGTETLLVEALEQLKRGRTTLIIAHRLSTVRNATRIVVLDQGRVVEEGTHRDLLDRRGAYHRFHEWQFGGAGGQGAGPVSA